MAPRFCAGRATSTVVRDTMGNGDNTSRRFRGRAALPAPGAKTEFTSNFRALTFDSNFYAACDRWGRNLAYLFNTAPSPLAIQDWADVGTIACHRYSWAHNRARGMDLCAVRFTTGYVIDCNYSHQAEQRRQRHYLAVWSSLRRFFGTVLTADYNSAHRDHIHFDNRFYASVISRAKRSDTLLVQRSAALLLDQNIAIDGNWGPQTSRAYNELLEGLNMACRDPLRVRRDAMDFLYFITRTAIANETTGRYRSVEC